MRRALDSDEGFGDQRNFMAMHDADGSVTTTVLWTDPGEDLFGAVARCERVVEGAERLLGGEVYHYHSKLTLKAPGTGGAWNWHQDYGYWYFNGNLFPDMLSVFIAIDPATRENGCLQVIRGSARMGRPRSRIGGRAAHRRAGARGTRLAAAGRRLVRRWTPATRSSCTATRCTARPRTPPGRAATCCFAATTPPPTTPTRTTTCRATRRCTSCRTARSRRAAASTPGRPDASCAPTITRWTRRRFPAPDTP